MLRAIKLDHEARSKARKIGHIVADRNLAAEMRAFRFKLTKLSPQCGFRAGLVGAKPARRSAPEFHHRIL